MYVCMYVCMYVTQVCFGISVSNFMCMSTVAVGRSLTIVSYVAFKIAALWFWTMFNCNPPIAHCHPLLWGGGILVDRWSTISRFICCLFIVVTWWYVWCIEWASGDQEEVQACLVTLWLFIISCYSLYKTTTNPHFHKYSMDFHV